MKRSLTRKITGVTPYFISLASLIFAGQFLYHTIEGSLSTNNILWIMLTLLISILVFVGLRSEIRMVRKITLKPADYRFSVLAKSFFVVVSSALATYYFTAFFNTTTIFSASLICVIYTYLFPENQPEAYSGTVGGMIGAYLCGDWTVAFTTAIVTGFVFLLFKPYFLGVGGRGGSIPYVGTTLAVRMIFQLVPRSGTPIPLNFIFPSSLMIIFIAFLTYILHAKGILTIVRAAMILVFLSEILIPANYAPLITAAFAGSVVGMSTTERIEDYKHLLLVSIIASLLFIPAFHILDGIGGKLGILCLVSYYGSTGLKLIARSFVKTKEIKPLDI